MVNQTLSGKRKRMFEAARLRHMEDKSNSEIADILGITTGTVENYFSDDEMQEFKRFYSDMDKFKLQQKLERELWDKTNLVDECITNAKENADSSRAWNKTAQTAVNTYEKKVKLLQELGVIEKPKERREVTDNTSDEALERLSDVYEKYHGQQEEEEEEDQKEEVEA